jgi:hypothetical protein
MWFKSELANIMYLQCWQILSEIIIELISSYLHIAMLELYNGSISAELAQVEDNYMKNLTTKKNGKLA